MIVIEINAALILTKRAENAIEVIFKTIKPDAKHIEKVLKDLSLWDKKDLRLRQLSGGMKRRVLIAKALSHEPSILFLDEPTAGVDVELRKDMWKIVEDLRKTGVTVILTTHYIEEEIGRAHV